MSTSPLRFIAAAALIAAITSTAGAQPAPAGVDLPPVPPGLQVQAGHSVFLKGRAVGTQNYICLQTTAGIAWRFLGPQATLFDAFEGVDRQVTTHYLSANPMEDGLARPTWQHSRDSSAVWGRLVASSSDQTYVEPGAIAWLLLEAAGTAPGSAGSAVLAQTTFIQRLNTSGGIAPASGCAQVTDVGRVALVPYATDYFFYRENNRR